MPKGSGIPRTQGCCLRENPDRRFSSEQGELKRMLEANSGNLKKLFNTSGEVYRAMKLGSKLDSMPESEALDLLASNAKLIKRPIAFIGERCLVGFNEEEWKKSL
jgi:arsenate reductase (glutaredoxin)